MSTAYTVSANGGMQEAERLRAQARLVIEQELGGLVEALPKGGRFVDLGCGSGLLCAALAEARPDAEVLGVDTDALAVAEARRLFSGPRVRFEQRSVLEAPQSQDEMGDVAVLRLVLMHLPGPLSALRGLQRWLKPDGVLHIIEADDRGLRLDPEPEGFDDLLDILERVQQAHGGSRRLGGRLPELLQASGWSLSGESRSAPDPEQAAKALPQVFLPVARFYLERGEREGHVDKERVQNHLSVLTAAAERGFQRAELPLYRAWARLSKAVR